MSIALETSTTLPASTKATPVGFDPLQRFVFQNMNWDQYTLLLNSLGDNKLRHSYNQGVLEIMSPTARHERYKTFISRLIEALTLELNMPICCLGSLTMRLTPQEQGIEPDECYFIQHEQQVRELDSWSAHRDPPPDLAIEMEVTNSVVARLPIFAKLGVSEIWRYDGIRLTFWQLDAKQLYQEISSSNCFPGLNPEHLQRYLNQVKLIDETTLIRQFMLWARNHFTT